ncbi:MAG: GMC family oxidoreductase [Pseudomonadota bacterium]
MFVDARSIENGKELSADLCIIGAGAAGITLATSLENSKISTILLEAGDTQPDQKTQSIYEGVVRSEVLPSSYLTTSRARYFGGTTNLWGGHSVVINSNIFTQRSVTSGRGWPISASDLRPYYARAAEILGVRSEVRSEADTTIQRNLAAIERYPVGRGERRMGHFNAELLKRSNTRVLLNANVTSINPDRANKRITDVIVETLSGRRIHVNARAFVLATGGIENARLLLLPTAVDSSGIGNSYGLVGRNFSEHFFGRGRMIETASLWPRDGEVFSVMSSQLQEKYALPEVGLLRHYKRTRSSDGDHIVSSLAQIMDATTYPRIASLDYYYEVPPAPENRVMLSEQLDPFGRPKAELRFNLSPELIKLYSIAVELYGRIAGQGKIGRVQIVDHPMWLGNHHMNTTPMSNDPSQGVVDANGRVHGYANIFVAGSSIFPTSGCGNPTFPLIALTFRLSDFLRNGFKRNLFAV